MVSCLSTVGNPIWLISNPTWYESMENWTTPPVLLSFLFLTFSHIFTLPYVNPFPHLLHNPLFSLVLTVCTPPPPPPPPLFQCVCSSFPGVCWPGLLSYSPVLVEQPHLIPLALTVHILYFNASTDLLALTSDLAAIITEIRPCTPITKMKSLDHVNLYPSLISILQILIYILCIKYCQKLSSRSVCWRTGYSSYCTVYTVRWTRNEPDLFL